MDSIKILVIEPDISTGELITKSLKRSFAANVILCHSSEIGLNYLKNNPYYSLIIIGNRSNESGISPAEAILNFLYDRNLEIPLMIIGEFEHSSKNFTLIPENPRVEEINRLVLKILGLKKEDFDYLKLPDYVAFPLKYFYSFKQSPCDIFIRLSKKTGDNYVRKIKLGISIIKEDLDTYADLGVSDFYIKKEEYNLFMNGLLSQTLINLKSSNQMETIVEASAESFMISTELLKTIGVTPVCISMVDETVNKMMDQIQKVEKMGPLLRRLLDDKMSYSYRRSYLICVLSYMLLPRMEWGSVEQHGALLEKICMVSYFHDIFLEQDKHIQVNSQTDLRNMKLTTAESEMITNHAYKAATLVQNYPKLPPGVDLIIKQHHGVINGIGFPETLTASISPMAIFFMVVEDFAAEVLAIPQPNENLSLAIRETIKPLKDKYTLPSYRKIVNEIDLVFGQKIK